MKELFKDEALIKRFGDGANGVKPYRAFAIKHGDLLKWVDYHILNEYRIQDILKEYNVKRAYFKFYGKIFGCFTTLSHYLGNGLFKSWTGKQNYINEDDIMKYVDTIMEEYLP